MEEGSANDFVPRSSEKNSMSVAGRTRIKIPESREGPLVYPLLWAVVLLAF